MANIVDTYYQAKSSVRETIKTLRTNISFSSKEQDLQTLVVASPAARMGKTTIASFLGIAFAETGKKVLLVDTDCRRTMVANYFRQRPQFGLLQVLYNEVSLAEAAEETRQVGLYILDCGGKITNPVEFINSRRFVRFTEMAKKEFDIIIYDTPPLGTFIDAALLAARADGTIIIMQPGKVQVNAAKDALDQLEKANAHVLGIVFNSIVNVKAEGYYYYYGKGGKRKKGGNSRDHAKEDGAAGKGK
ncbi:MAG: CpsD/CapB family tyrosine-protein kinase [Clostridia bacterium]|nr:CpsD/CapB family tyrosine-protein kinase [Clostridia bacterium]